LGGGYYGEKSYGDDYYYVVNYDTIGFLGTVIIHTDLAESLSNWLTNNGYEIPSKAPEIFQEYIDQDWKYFFVARADTSTINYYYGQNAGVRLKFATSKIFYPMKISSISSKDATKLYLYVIGEHKFFFDDAELEYANKISSKELAAIEEDLPNLSGYIKNSDYITKLMKNFKSSDEMDEDITIYQAADDIEYRGHSSEEDYYLFGLANSLLPFLLIYIIFVGLGRIKKRRKEYE
jgi:hypothetical protein